MKRNDRNTNTYHFVESRKPDRLALPATIVGFILGGLIVLLSGCGSTAPMNQAETALAYVGSCGGHCS